MYTALKYRTFDELLDSVKIDLKGVDIEGLIDPQTLIKKAMKVNKELGIKLNPKKATCLEIENNSALLPPDFSTLSLAYLAINRQRQPRLKSRQTQVTEDLLNGLSEMLTNAGLNSIKPYSTVITLKPGINIISHKLNTIDVVVQLRAASGETIFADYTTPTVSDVSILFSGTVDIPNVNVTILGVNSLPYNENNATAELVTDVNGNPEIKLLTTNYEDTFKGVIPLQVKRHRAVSLNCPNLFNQSQYIVSLNGNRLQANFNEGTVFIEYASVMEDEDGNLLVLDHEFVNDYYEYALKELIFENMYLNDEPNLERKIQYVAQKLRTARLQANSFVNTPDFHEMQKVTDANRKAQRYKFYSMFK